MGCWRIGDPGGVFEDFVVAGKAVRPKSGTSVAARMLARSPTRAWKSIWSCGCIFCGCRVGKLVVQW